MRGTISQSRAVVSIDPVKAHLPSVSLLLSLSRRYAQKEHEDYYQDLKDPRGVQCNLEIPLRPTYHLVSVLLSLSRRYALKGHEDYYQDLKDPRVVQWYHQIQLRPTYHLMSELLRLSQSVCPERTRGLLPGFERSQSRAVLSLDPVNAHLPSGVRATENIQSVCPERTRGLLSGFVRFQNSAVLSLIQLKPTYHLVSELLSISSPYALKEPEDYFQDLKDPRSVQCYLEIQLMPTAIRCQSY